MIVDITGVVLLPGNGGADCPGNGQGVDEKGAVIESCCDECDYLLCCVEPTDCRQCTDNACPRAGKE